MSRSQLCRLSFALLAACSADGLDERVFPDEPLGLHGSAIVYGSGRDDLWAPLPGMLGGKDGSRAMHRDGSGVMVTAHRPETEARVFVASVSELK